MTRSNSKCREIEQALSEQPAGALLSQALREHIRDSHAPGLFHRLEHVVDKRPKLGCKLLLSDGLGDGQQYGIGIMNNRKNWHLGIFRDWR